ncbi:DUF5615 family PIN-like protein [Synechocystis sp. LKSZ1]|uniref:DUF5615 family PIN-like protein n=1 Tax=Synechocystis sp. LKSZ1 TaxID=3144951 RepID=UPI00336C1E81
MKGYLFDENLPANVTFQSSLPIYHVSSLGKSPTGSQIWEYAKVNNLIIVTKDADFSERLMIDEFPAKVVHLRFGNMRRKDFHQFLAKIWPEVEKFIIDYKINKHICRLY